MVLKMTYRIWICISRYEKGLIDVGICFRLDVVRNWLILRLGVLIKLIQKMGGIDQGKIVVGKGATVICIIQDRGIFSPSCSLDSVHN